MASLDPAVFQSWFDNSQLSDVLFHVRCEAPDEEPDQQVVDATPAPAAEVEAVPADSEDRQAAGRKRGRRSAGAGGSVTKQPANTKRSKAAAASEGGHVEQSERSYHLHRVVLSASSNYFKALFTNWNSQQQQAGSAGTSTSSSGSGVLEHVERVQPGDMEAMHLLLRLMYGHVLPGGEADPSFAMPLLRCAVLADRLSTPALLDIVLQQLVRTVSPCTWCISCAFISALACVPPGIAASNYFKSILEGCRKSALRVLQPKGDGPSASTRLKQGQQRAELEAACRHFIYSSYLDCSDVIRSTQMRKEFCDLSFEALLGWVQSEELKVCTVGGAHKGHSPVSSRWVQSCRHDS